MSGVCTHLITLHRRGSGFVLRVDDARWGQTPEDLRHLALSAPHARTRERALALCDIPQHRQAELGEAVCAAQRTAATPPLVGADPAPRWTLRRLVGWARERFGLVCCRETIRAAL